MDTSPDPARAGDPPSSTAPQPRGGSIEPDTTGPRKTNAGPAPEPADKAATGERYELRDPFNEVIYHSKRFDEITAKAEQLGSNRFTAIDAQGQRTLVRQVDGQWARGGPRSVETPEAVAGSAAPAKTPSARAPEIPAAPTAAPTQTAEKTERADTSQARQLAQADRAARISQLEAALSERYVVKRGPATADLAPKTTEYRFRGDTQRVAFTETSFKLATAINSPSVARSMVDVAETRQWKSLRVSGNEDFKRMVWLEASVRNIKAVGYEPTRADQALLQREREARQVNRIEPVPEATATATPKDKASTDPAKASARGGGGSRKTVLAAIDAVLVAKKVPQAQREAVLAAATKKLASRSRETPAAKIRVYDMSAPSQRPMHTPNPEVQRTRERAGPAPAR